MFVCLFVCLFCTHILPYYIHLCRYTSGNVISDGAVEICVYNATLIDRTVKYESHNIPEFFLGNQTFGKFLNSFVKNIACVFVLPYYTFKYATCEPLAPKRFQFDFNYAFRI